jgi:phenylacetate-coenzyme A ligase PaaK-like adenylate-forming protein
MVSQDAEHLPAETAKGDDPVDQPYVDALVAERLTRDLWSRDNLLSYQFEQLKTTLQHAVERSPYYRKALGPHVARGAALPELPILTKRTLMTEFDRIVTDRRLNRAVVEQHVAGQNADGLLLGEYRICASGGTTGVRTIIAYDRRAWASNLANFFRFQRMFGASPGCRIIGISSPSLFHLSNQVWGRLPSAGQAVPRLTVTMPISEVVESLNAYQPDYLLTFPSFLRRLAEEQRAGRLRISPRLFRTGAEALTQDLRELCREVWGVPVLNGYAITEAGVLGGECLHAAGMHLAEDTAVFEVVDDACRAVPVGFQGTKLLVTSLTNRVFPLIRYEVSDILTLTDQPCVCGRPYARIASIEGRREETLQFPACEGGTVAVHAARLRAPLIRTAGVCQFQIRRLPDGLMIRISVRGDRRPENAQAVVKQEVCRVLAEAGAIVEEVIVEVVEDIQPEAAGGKERLFFAGE